MQQMLTHVRSTSTYSFPSLHCYFCNFLGTHLVCAKYSTRASSSFLASSLPYRPSCSWKSQFVPVSTLRILFVAVPNHAWSQTKFFRLLPLATVLLVWPSAINVTSTHPLAVLLVWFARRSRLQLHTTVPLFLSQFNREKFLMKI